MLYDLFRRHYALQLCLNAICFKIILFLSDVLYRSTPHSHHPSGFRILPPPFSVLKLFVFVLCGSSFNIKISFTFKNSNRRKFRITKSNDSVTVIQFFHRLTSMQSTALFSFNSRFLSSKKRKKNITMRTLNG